MPRDDEMTLDARKTSDHTGVFDGVIRRASRFTREQHGWVPYLRFAPDGKTLAAADHHGGRVQLWDVDALTHRDVHVGDLDIADLAFAADGGALYVVGSDALLHVIDLRGGATRALAGNTAPIERIAVSARGDVITAGADRTVRLWQIARGTSTVGHAHAEVIGALAFAPDGVHFASGDDSGQVLLWSLPELSTEGGTLLRGNVLDLAYDASGDHLGVATTSGAFLVDAHSGANRALRDRGAYAQLAFSRDGLRIAAAGVDATSEWPDDLPRDEAGLRAWLAAAAAARFAR
jgi:WD40 repeat protein